MAGVVSPPWLLLLLHTLPCLPSSVFVQPGTELWAGADILIGCYTGTHAQVSSTPHPVFSVLFFAPFSALFGLSNCL